MDIYKILSLRVIEKIKAKVVKSAHYQIRKIWNVVFQRDVADIFAKIASESLFLNTQRLVLKEEPYYQELTFHGRVLAAY